MNTLKYLAGYSPTVKDQVQMLINSNKLSELLIQKYPMAHQIRSDKALYNYVMAIKTKYIKKSAPLSKIVYDDKIDVLHHALGLHTIVSRVQGSNLKAKNEIRVGSIFKKVPIEFLQMIVVHELAHLREKQHNKAFYKLCQHMQPEYHQLEFDTRLYLTHIELLGTLY